MTDVTNVYDEKKELCKQLQENFKRRKIYNQAWIKVTIMDFCIEKQYESLSEIISDEEITGIFRKINAKVKKCETIEFSTYSRDVNENDDQLPGYWGQKITSDIRHFANIKVKVHLYKN